MTERFEWIDHAKGIAILLVVIGHVWLGIYQAGLFEVTPLFSGAPSSLLDGELPKFQPCVIHVSDSAGPMHHS